MYTDSQIKPLLALVAEISSMSSADGCAAGYTVTCGHSVVAAAAVAASLEKTGASLVFGQHDNRHNSSYYAFLVPQGTSFDKDDFAEYLGETFEPAREEFANVIVMPDQEIVLLDGERAADPSAGDASELEKLIDAAKSHGEESEPDHEVGDLQDYLRAMWELLTPQQRLAFPQLPAVRTTFAAATGDDE